MSKILILTTALMHALQHGQKEIASYLIDRGADPSKKIPMDPVTFAKAHGYTGLVRKMEAALK